MGLDSLISESFYVRFIIRMNQVGERRTFLDSYNSLYIIYMMKTGGANVSSTNY